MGNGEDRAIEVVIGRARKVMLEVDFPEAVLLKTSPNHINDHQISRCTEQLDALIGLGARIKQAANHGYFETQPGLHSRRGNDQVCEA